MITQTLKSYMINGSRFNVLTVFIDGIVSRYNIEIFPNKNKQFWKGLGLEELR